MRIKMLFNFITFLLSFGVTSVWAASQNEWTPKNWSIVVSSCDKYSALWEPFFTALKRNWPALNSTHKDLEIYLIANAKQYDNGRVKTVNIPNEKSWSDTMLTALEKIDSKYILFFLEDYWITKLDQQRLFELMERFEKEDAAYLDLLQREARLYSKNQRLDKIEGVVHRGKFQNYRANLQLGLWEKRALQQLLRSSEDIWTFELAASVRSSGYPKPFLTLIANPPIIYLNATHQGHINPIALEFVQQQGINFVNTMPVLGKYNWDLTWKRWKHKISKATALVKKYTIGEEGSDSYLYSFED